MEYRRLNENIKLSQRDITDDFHLGLGQFHGSRNNERINTVTLLYGKNALKQNKNKGSRQRETEKKQETYNKLLDYDPPFWRKPQILILRFNLFWKPTP